MAAALVAMFIPTEGKAQQRTLSANLNYNIGIPTGNFKDFVSDASPRGFTADIVYGINDRISIGFGTGYQDFYQKYPRQVYKLSTGGDISAVVTNSLQVIPVLALAKFNLAPGKAIQPYIGVGVGGNLVMYNQYLGEFSNSDNAFRFAARPEAGFFIPFKKGMESAGINISGAYNYMPYKNGGLENLNHWGMGLGIRIPVK